MGEIGNSNYSSEKTEEKWGKGVVNDASEFMAFIYHMHKKKAK